jgi:ATP-binding cassette, subfamily C, bacterial CydC
MNAILQICTRLYRGQRQYFLRGLALSLCVLLAGIGLLGLSGWFIVAAGMAGMAGVGIMFDVFRPSAGIRLLALGRAAARYGERMVNHDTTLRSLAQLRIDLLRALAQFPFIDLARYRASEMLNRLTVDVDALDGITLKLIIPALSGLAATATAILFLIGIGNAAFAYLLLAFFIPGAALTFVLIFMKALKPSRLIQTSLNSFRLRLLDLLAARTELTVFGRLTLHRDNLLAVEGKMRRAMLRNDRIERAGGFALAIIEALTMTGALLAGIFLVLQEIIAPQIAALGFFVVMALLETITPLRRGLSEFGRIANASGRINKLLHQGEHNTVPAIPYASAGPASGHILEIRSLSFRHAGAKLPLIKDFNLCLKAGEIVAITGPSGCGKSTLLQLAAGMITPDEGIIYINGIPICAWSEDCLRQHVTLLPQRSALLSGTVCQNLELAKPDITIDEAESILRQVALSNALAERGGVSYQLGEFGSGLSGGEMRRLVLARALLRRPALLLLDEPTENLDEETAARVLATLRASLPQTAILIASHRRAEQIIADRIIALC